MAKSIPAKFVEEYISLDAQIVEMNELKNKMKVKLRNYHERGFSTPLLQFKESSYWKPNWKLLVKELLEKFMTPGQRRTFMRKLQDRFPRKDAEVGVLIVGKGKSSQEDDE